MESSTSNSPSLLGLGLQGLQKGLPILFISPKDMLQIVYFAVEEEMDTKSTFLVSAIVELGI